MFARTALSGGSLSRCISARASSGPSWSHHIRAIQSGCEWASAAPSGVRVVERGDSGAASRAARRMTAFAKPVARGEHRLGELDRLLDGRVGGHAVQEEELEDAEPQRVAQRRRRSCARARDERRVERVVERAQALHRAVGELLRERALAGVEAGALGLGAEGAVGAAPPRR